MNTLSSDLTQLTEPNSSTRPGAADAADVRQQLSGKHVCPFCGVIRADALQPCPRCTMEDSSATRSATRQRIGPWFVLQARNPSAPGMRYVTLLSLVRKGHVTPRSIVRGPTTHQLWTFAASVRGLSREFGICYHCAEQIDSASPNCSHCLKSQDLPPDPDALLEPVPEMSVSAQPTSSETGMDGAGTSLDLQAEPYPDETPVPAPAVPRPAPPSIAASVASLPAIAPRPRPASTAPSALATRQAIERAATKEEAILSAKELAAAFQLDFKPPGQQGGKRFGFFRTIAALILIGAIGTGIVMFLRPELREQSITWVSNKWDNLRAELDRPAGAKPIPSKPAATTNDAPKPKPQPPVAIPPTPTPAPAPAVTPAPANVPPEPPAATPKVEPPPEQPIVVAPKPTPPPEVKPPAPAPAPIPAPAPAPAAEIEIPADVTIEQATELGKQLRLRAMDAEGKRDWNKAVELYHQIQRLPRDAWPADLDTKLRFARSKAG